MLKIVSNASTTLFLVPAAKKAFQNLRLTFITASILQYFNSELHIYLETDTFDYAIRGILSQLIGNTWHPIVYYFRKMILAETWYKTYNDELLAIVKAFKT